jgi:type IV secretory pathway VirB10-like protein
MRSAGNFSPEWGYLAPAPSFARTARIVLVATAIGATAGAGVVLTLVDRSPEPRRASVAARAIVTSVHEAAAPIASQMSAPPTAPAAAPVAAPLTAPASPPANSPLAPSDVASQSVTPSENPASANTRETSAIETSATPTNAAPANVTDKGATQPNSEPADAASRSAAGVATLSEPSAAGSANTADGQEPASTQKKVKHHLANDRPPFRGFGTLFRRFFVAHAARPDYLNR